MSLYHCSKAGSAAFELTSAFIEFSCGFTVAILSSLFVLLPEKIYHLL